MKEKLVMVVLIFSLTVNAAALITMGYFWGREYGGGQGDKKEEGSASFSRELSLDRGQRGRMRDTRRAFIQETSPVRHALATKRAELASLLASDATDRISLEQKLREINDLQFQMQIAVINQLRREKEFLTPEQQQRYVDIITHRLCQDPMGAGRGPRGYRGGGMGRKGGVRGAMEESETAREPMIPAE